MSREKVELTPEMIEELVESAGLTPDAPSYKKKLHWLGSQIAPNLHNAVTILKEEPRLRNLLSYDEFFRTQLIHFPVPEYAGAVFGAEYTTPRVVEPSDVMAILQFIQCVGSYKMPTGIVEEAIAAVAYEKRFHPVKDYFSGLKWDGVPRIKTWLHDWAGAEEGPYSEVAGTMVLVAAVARTFDPGCKNDYMVILEGPQGIGKSTIWSILGGLWFSDSLPDDITSKDAMIHLAGALLIECGELGAMKKNEAEHLKAFISKMTDQYRPPYGRREVKEPRRCVFVGTTNQDEYLKDETGNRRYIPVKVSKRLDREGFKAVRDQLWAEAVALYMTGTPHHPSEEFEAEFLKPEQTDRRVTDPWMPKIAPYVAKRNRVTYTLIIENVLYLSIDRVDARVYSRIRSVMKDLGWVHQKIAGQIYFLDPKKNEV